MANHSIQRKEFDPITFEADRQEKYDRSVKEEKFSKQYSEKGSTTFYDGKWDGVMGFEPEDYQWLNRAYRAGYLAGVAERFDEQFTI